MAFWKNFGFTSHSVIDDILDRPEFTLEDLLSESELLKEVKCQNNRLIDFLSNPEQLEKLLEYILNDGKSERNHQSLQWNIISCEVICSEISQITNNFLENSKLIDNILNSFIELSVKENIDRNEEMKLAILSKILITYLPKNPDHIMNLLKDKHDVIDLFIKYISNKDVIEVLLKVIEINFENPPDWFNECSLIDQLVIKFEPSQSVVVHENIAYVLERIITLCYDYNINSPLLGHLQKIETVKTIMDNALLYKENRSSKSALIYGINVIIRLLKENVNDKSSKGKLQVYNVCLEYIGNILSFLEYGKENGDSLNLPSGKIEPFGIVRMKIMELLEVLLTCEHEEVIRVLIENNVLEIILNLFFYFKLNNFLHIKIYEIFSSILNGNNQTLINNLLLECRMIDRMIEAHEINIKEVSENRIGRNCGYIGILKSILYIVWKIINDESKMSLKSEIESSTEWKRYIELYNTIYDEIDKGIKLGNVPTYESQSEDDDDFYNDEILEGEWDEWDDDEEFGDESDEEPVLEGAL